MMSTMRIMLESFDIPVILSTIHLAIVGLGGENQCGGRVGRPVFECVVELDIAAYLT